MVNQDAWQGERVEMAGNIRAALERALAANQAGQPAVIEFVLGTSDYSWGFKDYYRRLGELPGGLEPG